MLIEIKGVQFVNKGAELMLHAILQQLKLHLPHAEICLAHNVNSPYKKRAAIGAYQKINLRKNIFDFNSIFYFVPAKARNYFKERFGVVTEADVDVVLDASGFSYGDQWPDLILRQVASEVSRLKRKKKIYIFMPQSLGPFTRKKNKLYATKAFSDAKIVFAREKPSYQYIHDLLSSTTRNYYQMPDFTNLVTAMSDEQYIAYKNHLIVVPNSKMLSSKNKDQHWKTNYTTMMVTLINQAMNEGVPVVILNHSGHDDRDLCLVIQQGVNSPCDIIEPATAIAVKSVIGMARAVVSSRFHGCVSALSQGIPCIATGWSHKYQELFREYKSEHLLLTSQMDEYVLQSKLHCLLNPEPQWLDTLHATSEQYKAQSTEMWKKIFAEI